MALSRVMSKPRQFPRVGIDKNVVGFARGFAKPTISSRWCRGYKATTNPRNRHNWLPNPRCKATQNTRWENPPNRYCSWVWHNHDRYLCLYTIIRCSNILTMLHLHMNYSHATNRLVISISIPNIPTYPFRISHIPYRHLSCIFTISRPLLFISDITNMYNQQHPPIYLHYPDVSTT